MWTVTTVFLARLMLSLLGRYTGPGAGPLAAAWLGLYQSPTATITPQSTLANIVEANFSGYSRQLIVWFPPFIEISGPEIITAQDLFWTPADATVSNFITGCFIADSFYGGALLMAAPAPAPGFVLNSPSRGLKVQPQYSQQFLTVYGSPAFVG